MGSIYRIYPVEQWDYTESCSVKNVGEDILKVIIGECDDHIIDGISVYMLKSHFDNCKSGKWQVKREPYTEHKIILIDENGKSIGNIKNFIY